MPFMHDKSHKTKGRGKGWIWFIAVAVLCFFLAMPTEEPKSFAIKTTCLSNMKQCVVAASLYAADVDDRFPPATVWMDVIDIYTKTESVFHDPAVRATSEYGLAFRRRASGVKLAALQSPAQFVLVFDSKLTARNAHSELWSIPRPGRHPASDNGNSDNMAFADSHAKSFVTNIDVGNLYKATPLDEALMNDDAAGSKL